jgi:hypothetical protein
MTLGLLIQGYVKGRYRLTFEDLRIVLNKKSATTVSTKFEKGNWSLTEMIKVVEFLNKLGRELSEKTNPNQPYVEETLDTIFLS